MRQLNWFYTRIDRLRHSKKQSLKKKVKAMKNLDLQTSPSFQQKKDAINPIITVNDFLQGNIPIDNKKKENTEGKESTHVNKLGEKELELINKGESIDETLLENLGKRILKDTNRSKSDPDLFKTKSKNNERYGNNRYCTKKKLN